MVYPDLESNHDDESGSLVAPSEKIVRLPKASEPSKENVNQGESLLNGACGHQPIHRHSLHNGHDAHLPRYTSLEMLASFPNLVDDELGPPSPPLQGPPPPDGGLRAWVVMVASFLCNGIIFGTINSSGTIFVSLKEMLENEGQENTASLASVTLSLAIGTTFMLSLLAGVLTDKLGVRTTTIAGGAIATAGMFLSSVYYKQAVILIFSMGLVFGVGSSLAYTPSLVILGHYFVKRLGFVNGFVTAGSSVFTILITELLKYVIETHGLKTAFQVLTGLMSILMLCGLTFKPFLHHVHPQHIEASAEPSKGCWQRFRSFLSIFINFQIWKNKKFVIWILALPSALFGYFVPYVHLIAYVKDVLGPDSQGKVLVQCISATSGVGRLVFGYIADKPFVNRIALQQLSFFSIGILTMLLTTCSNFWVFVAISLGMGLFDGCFISLFGPIAFDIVGPAGASQAIGAVLAACSIPLTLGPFIAGVIYDALGNYRVPFLVAGVSPILGGFALFFMRCVKDDQEGTIRSPARDPCQLKKNNLTATSKAAEVAEAGALETVVEVDDTNGESQNVTAPLQVDVKQLVHIQRESSV